MSPKIQLFVEKYLGEANLNAAAAARLAGYSRDRARQQGYDLLGRADVQAAIKARFEVATIGADAALYMLSEQARGTLAPFLYDEYADAELTPRGLINMDSETARENVHLLKEVTQQIVEFEGGRKVTNKVKLHDPQAALITILRAQGGFNKSYADDLLKFLDFATLSVRQLELLQANEPILKVLLASSQDADENSDLGTVEDDLPPALVPNSTNHNV